MAIFGYTLKKESKKTVTKSYTDSNIITNTSHILSALGGLDTYFSFKGGNVKKALTYEVLDTGIRFLCNCFTQVKFKALDEENNEIDHEILNSIRNPNTLQSRNDLLYQWCYYFLCENVVYQVVKNKSLLSPFDFELINLNPDNLTLKRKRKSILELTTEDVSVFYKEHFIETGQYITTELNKDLLLRYSKGLSVDNINTNSPFDSLSNELKNIEVAKKAKHNKLKLSGAIIGTPKPTNDSNEMGQKITDTVIDISQNGETHKTLAEKTLRNSGLHGNDFVKLMTVPMQFNSLTKDLNSLDFEKEIIPDYRKIYRKIGISDDLTGLDGKRATYENQLKSLIQLYQTTIQNLADTFTGVINNSKMEATGVRVVGDYTHLPIFTSVEKEKQECIASDINTHLELLDRDLISKEDFKEKFKL